MDIVERLRMCNDKLSTEAAAEIGRLRDQAAIEIDRLKRLLIRKNEALAIVADPAMWHQVKIWNGTAEFADPMAWAKREAEAEEPDSR